MMCVLPYINHTDKYLVYHYTPIWQSTQVKIIPFWRVGCHKNENGVACIAYD